MNSYVLLLHMQQSLDETLLEEAAESEKGINVLLHALALQLDVPESEALARKALEKASYDAGFSSLQNAVYLTKLKQFKRIVAAAIKSERERLNKFS